MDNFVHISVKKKDVLFYNVYSGKLAEFPSVKYGETILQLTRKLLVPTNFRVIRLTPQDLDNPVISEFVATIRGYFMGDLIDADFSDTKPAQVVPARIKVQEDYKKYLQDPDNSLGKSVMEYLFQLTLYLNDSCSQGCSGCRDYYKQGIWCRASKKGDRNLDIPVLKKLFHEIEGSNPNNIDITGGNILLYPHWNQLAQLLDKVDARLDFHIHYLNAQGDLALLERFKDKKHQIRLLVQFPLDAGRFKQAYQALSGLGLNVSPVFFIRSDDEYSVVEKMLAEFPVDSPNFVPYFDGSNLEFFKRNFFLSREDIEGNKPGQKIIHGNSKINLDNFAKMTVLSNGKIHANVLDPALGTLENDSIYDCIFKELKTGRSWYKLRKNVSPCKSCNFEMLCPPISNYNRVIGKNNLCFIRETHQ